jgi:hypothetical protein
MRFYKGLRFTNVLSMESCAEPAAGTQRVKVKRLSLPLREGIKGEGERKNLSTPSPYPSALKREEL